jgi:hypothetical protein
MELAALHTLTLQALREMYTAFEAGRLHEGQFLQNLNTGSVTTRVALQAAEADLWVPSEPITAALRPAAGRMLPEEDQKSIRSIMWQLVGLGILIPRSIKDPENQFFELSSYGVEVLREEEPSPYDPFGFIRRLTSDAPHLESETVEYVQEAVETFLSRHFRAAAVMTGLASENEILKLIELFADTLEQGARSAFDQAIGRCRNLRGKFDRLYERLNQAKGDLPADIRELDTWLAGTFQVIRLTRNDAGHPTGQKPSREAVYANLNFFLTYARHLSILKDHLRAKARKQP